MSGAALVPIGRLRQRLTLEAPAEVDDGAGGVSRSFVALATVWAAVIPTAAVEIAEADRVSQRVTHRITLRWRAGVTAAMRFTKGARVWRIMAATDPDGTRRRLDCLAEEVSP
jgi:SPP1 family predicted phage head-tail adaptor